jgi:type I restriction enzyme M protein
MAEFRHNFQIALLDALLPVGVLDEFQVAGIFAKWWEAVQYDFKTIVAAGWSVNLIPDEYIINAFFKAEQNEIETLENRVMELAAELSEALDAAEVQKEGEENEENNDKAPTATERKKDLKAKIVELKTVCNNEEDQVELKNLSEILERIESIEKPLKVAKKHVNSKRVEMGKQIITQRRAMGPEEVRTMIKQKLYNLIVNENNWYLKQIQREISGVFEKFWDKYEVSITEIIGRRDENIRALNKYLDDLKYF